MDVLENIKKMCVLKGLSISDLERSIGVSAGSSYKWKKSTPKTETMQKIADFFGVSVDYLMTGKEPNYSDEAAILANKIRHDKVLADALMKYFELNVEQKVHVINTIDILYRSTL